MKSNICLRFSPEKKAEKKANKRTEGVGEECNFSSCVKKWEQQETFHGEKFFTLKLRGERERNVLTSISIADNLINIQKEVYDEMEGE